MARANANDVAIVLRRLLLLFRESARTTSPEGWHDLLEQIILLSTTGLGIVDILCPDSPVRDLTAAEVRLFELLGNMPLGGDNG